MHPTLILISKHQTEEIDLSQGFEENISRAAELTVLFFSKKQTQNNPKAPAGKVS